jgi:long-chain acyl-CoA synthetase
MMTQPKRLFDFPYYQLHQFPMEQMMTSRYQGEWKGYSTTEFVKAMNAFSKGLLALGVNPGDRIAIITHSNRCEWNIADCGTLQIGAIDVPIYPTMTEPDYEYIMNHSEVRYCFVSNEELYHKVKHVQPNVHSLKEIYTFEPVQGAPHWEEVLKRGESVDQSTVDALAAKVHELDLATIIYTSGTTGLPKGVMLSHRNIASNALDCEGRLPLLTKGQSRCLSFLPICHIYERMLHYVYMANGVSMYLTGMEAIKEDLNIARPHIFTAVPRLLEKVYDGIVTKGMANTGIKKVLFHWAHDLAMRWEPDGRNGAWYEFQLGIARKLVFSKVKAALGLTQIGGIASGSAALQPRLARFFNGASMWLMEGYGLTETSPVVSVNTFRQPGLYEVGTVGKLIPEVEVKIAEDGEIIVKGPNVMMGYYKNPEGTAEVLNDGWFRTGDIGEFRNGFLAITDRKKEIFKTSGGKYVAPQPIENTMKESIFIEQCMVVGENERFPGLLVVPDWLALRDWAGKNGVVFSNDEELIASAKVEKLYEQEIEKRNDRFGKWEQIKAFRFVMKPFSIEAGEITPTLKLKRKGILKNHHDKIQSMYPDRADGL